MSMQKIVEVIKIIIAACIAVLTAAYLLIGLLGPLLFNIDGAYLMSLYTGVSAIIFIVGVVVSLLIFLSWLFFREWGQRFLLSPPILLIWIGGILACLGITLFASWASTGIQPLEFVGDVVENLYEMIFSKLFG